MLCPSPGCQIRVRVITSESESESSPQSPSQKKKIRVRVTNLVVHIFNICLSSKTWKQTTKCIECQSKQRKTARPLLLGLGHDSESESRFLSPSPSPSQSEKKWDKPSLSPYSSHTALIDIRMWNYHPVSYQVENSVGVASQLGHLDQGGVFPHQYLVLGVAVCADLSSKEDKSTVNDEALVLIISQESTQGCETKSSVSWNAWKDRCAIQCIQTALKVWKMGSVKSKKV